MKQHLANFGITSILVIILTLSYTSSFGQSGNNVIIDDFSNNQAVIISTSGSPLNGSSELAANSIGGERDLSVELTSGSNALAEVVNGTFSMSIGAASEGNSTIVYDGTDGDSAVVDFTGLNGFDLTNGGTEDRYKISIISSDHPGNFTIEVYTDASNSSSVTKVFDEDMNPNDFEIFFNTFETNDGTGADFANVGAIVIRATGEPEIDLVIDRICTEGPPPTCGLTSITAGAPTCAGITDYTVVVSWEGADESVTLTAGGNGSPASVTTTAENGSQTFTYPVADVDYNITASDSEDLCGDLGTGLSGTPPDCTPPPTCGLTGVTGGDPMCGDNETYTVTMSWAGSDESVTLTAGGNGSPASVTTAVEDGSQTFTYPLTDTNYSITLSDTEELCSGGESGEAPTCTPPFVGVPTMGEWGLICLAFVFLIFGTKAMRQYVFKPTPSMK